MHRSASQGGELLPSCIGLAGFTVCVLPGGSSVNAFGMLVAILSLVPLLVRHRVWQTMSRSTASVLASCLGGAAVVLVTAHGAGLRVALYIVYGFLVYVAVTALATTATRRLAAAVAVCSLAVLELIIGWGRWVAAGNPNAPMTGSIGHWNQFATFLLAPGLLAGFMFVRGVDTRLRTLLWAAVFVGSGAGIWLSTSRTCLGLFVLGWLGTSAMIWQSTHRRAALLRWCAVPIGCVAAVLLLANPIFFHGHHYASPVLAHEGSRGTSTLAQNGGYRLTYIRASWQIFKHHVLVGSGFGSYPHAAARYLPRDVPRIFGSYNAWIDGLSAGGLVYGIPMIGAGIAGGAAVLRAARRAWDGRSLPQAALTWGIVIASVATFGHFAVDADTYYPQVVALAGALVGLAHGAGREARTTARQVLAERPLAAQLARAGANA